MADGWGTKAPEMNAPDVQVGPSAYGRWRASNLGALTEDIEHRLLWEVIGDPCRKLVLDLGCGDGLLARQAGQKGARVVGLDPDQAMLVSLLSMLPATVAYCLAGGALVSGKGDLKRTLLYFAAAAVFFVFVSLLPGWIKKRYADIGIVSKRTISSNRGPKPPTRVLFVCLHNSARSVMAEHFLRKYDGTSFLPESAGFEPTDVLPLAVEVMDEIGIDISGHRSQSVQELHQAGRSYDYIITLCSDFGGHSIPDFPGATLLHWSFEEPSTFNGSQQEKLFRTRKVRGQIQVATTNWVKELTTTY